MVSSIHSTQDCYYQVRSRWSDARPVAPTSHDAKRRHQGTPEEATEERTRPSSQTLTFVNVAVLIIRERFISVVKLLGVAQVAGVFDPTRDCCPVRIDVL